MSKIVVVGLSGESVFLTCDHFNAVGETICANSKFIEPGGKGYNQALAIGKIGGDITFITVFGNDNYKDICIKELKNNNVKICPIYKDIPSSYATILTNKDGENNVCVYHGASDLVTYEDIMKYQDEIDTADILLLQLEYPIKVIEKIIDYAYLRNIKVILNPAPFVQVSPEVLSKVYMITPNEHELMKMGNNIDINIALNNVNVSYIVCTRGASDILVKEKDDIYHIPVSKVKALDTTGAGDIFNAFLVYYLDKKTIKESIKFASIASSLSVLKKGVINAIPKLSEIKELK